MNQYEDFEFLCMGTNIFQRIYGDNAKEVAKIAEFELKNFEGLMNFFVDSSEVSKLNQAAGFNEVLLSKDTYKVIKKAKEYSELCGGSFDITIAPLVTLWSIFSKNQRVPSKLEIEGVLHLVNYKDIILNDEIKSAKLPKPGQRIDLGGIAKGYAADKIIKIYKKNGVKSAFINLGGNVLTLGNKPDGSPWSIGIQNPFAKRGEFIGAIKASNETIVTSGDYVRYFEADNARYHHILDPRTGYPSTSGIISATIIGKNSMQADALSTAIFILGLEKGLELINKINSLEAIFITSDKRVYVTQGASEKVVFIETKDNFEHLISLY